MKLYTHLIHKELVRCCANYNPEALGYWGMFGDGEAVDVELLDGTTVKVKGAQTVAALQALPAGTTTEQVKSVLLSERAAAEES